VASVAAGAITAAAVAPDAIGASELAADAVSEIQSGLATSSALALLAADITSALSSLATLLSSDTEYKKNVAVAVLPFPMRLAATGLPATGLTVSGAISRDGGAFAALAGSITEIGSGWYKVALTQAEMNADAIALKFTATGAIQRDIAIRTQS
jgi:hypothetical protein